MTPSRLRLTALQLVARLRTSKQRPYLLVTTTVVLVSLHLALALGSIHHKSATFDEIAHITAGYSYWTHGDYRLHPENGNLPQRWMTLPMVLLHSDLHFPSTTAENWHKSDLWHLGDEFFHHSDNDFELLLLQSRVSVALVSAALCLLVFFWSRKLFGNLGGVISLLLCAVSPTILAHGRLATSDLFATFFFAAAIWSTWELLHHFSLRRFAVCAAVVSALFLCKTSAVLILPIAGVMALISLIPQQTIVVRVSSLRLHELSSQWSRRVYVAVMTLTIGIVTYSTVWAAYGFRYSASVNSDHLFYKFQDIDTVAAQSGDIGKVAKWLADRRVLPEAYLYGVAYVAAHEERPAFFNGDYRTTGWPQFFPYCLAVKTPFAVFGLIAVGMLGLRSTSKVDDKSNEVPWEGRTGYQLVPIAVALFVFWAVFLTTQLNIGHRHILPTYPLMFVIAGGAASVFTSRHQRSIASKLVMGTVVVLMVWMTTDSLASYPHYLGYFNQLVPQHQAYRHLVDSSLDWGQDLPSLKKWLNNNSNNNEHVYLGYFGNADPKSYDIRATSLPLMGFGTETLELEAGIYCISATCLQGIYGEAPGRWNVQYEDYYQHLNEAFATEPPKEREAQLQWDVLKARRLCAFLRNREPDANAGFSILIYRVSDDELRAALDGRPVELDPLSWEMQRTMQAINADR